MAGGQQSCGCDGKIRMNGIYGVHGSSNGRTAIRPLGPPFHGNHDGMRKSLYWVYLVVICHVEIPMAAAQDHFYGQIHIRLH